MQSCDSIPHDSMRADYGAPELFNARFFKDFLVKSGIAIVAEKLNPRLDTAKSWGLARKLSRASDR